MDYEPLEIKDSERSTKGGPPGWIAFSTILGAAAVMAIVAIIIGIVT